MSRWRPRPLVRRHSLGGGSGAVVAVQTAARAHLQRPRGDARTRAGIRASAADDGEGVVSEWRSGGGGPPRRGLRIASASVAAAFASSATPAETLASARTLQASARSHVARTGGGRLLPPPRVRRRARRGARRRGRAGASLGARGRRLCRRLGSFRAGLLRRRGRGEGGEDPGGDARAHRAASDQEDSGRRRRRREAKAKAESEEDAEAPDRAATRIQAAHRGREARKVVRLERDPPRPRRRSQARPRSRRRRRRSRAAHRARGGGRRRRAAEAEKAATRGDDENKNAREAAEAEAAAIKMRAPRRGRSAGGPSPR